MLKQTQKTKEIYKDIQRKLFYMIPEKWEKLYLYASVIEKDDGTKTGEMFFYYIPKGILKKNPVNVYQIPAKFNINEKEYLELVEILYNEIKALREEYKKIELGETWSNITISIENTRFKIEYSYDDLLNSEYSSFARHIIWRYKYLKIGLEQVNKEEKEILKKYLTGAKNYVREEKYEAGIYIKDIKNIIDYDTTGQEEQEFYQENRKEELDKTNKEIKEKEKNTEFLFNNSRETKIEPNRDIISNNEIEKFESMEDVKKVSTNHEKKTKNQILSFLEEDKPEK